MRVAIFVACLFMLGTSAVADETQQPCRGSPRVVGACFQVHGRIVVTNGIPYRLWIVGTHRVLAPDEVPQSVLDLLLMDDDHPMSINVFGDYEVCPLEKEHPGWMRAVCIESASHLVATDWEGKIIRRR